MSGSTGFSHVNQYHLGSMQSTELRPLRNGSWLTETTSRSRMDSARILRGRSHDNESSADNSLLSSIFASAILGTIQTNMSRVWDRGEAEGLAPDARLNLRQRQRECKEPS